MTNRLAQAQSLYLRKHAENPIDWWPWCDEALETARRDNKPIFLSVGYSSCHWCTVMEGEAFSDTAIAEYMNANFLPIKVDREERPDIDSIYMQTVQMLTGQGGWPLNVFLSPDDLVPFYGGTYFPLEPRYGRPGFMQVLQTLRRYYDNEKEKVQALKDELLTNLQNSVLLNPGQDLSDELLAQGLEYNTGVLTAEGYGPSFPMIPYADMALHGIRFAGRFRYDAKDACTKRGLNLALGGIYDHVGGGFHRYTVDPTWTVPHFEKMLYDNGQIMEYLANLWSAGVEEPAFERAIAGTVQWLRREMTAPQGYFYAAQDADSFTTSEEAEPEEGAFYVWSHAELEQLLSAEELSELKQQFTVTPEGNFEGANVLQRREAGRLSDRLEQVLSKLFQVRYGAPPEAIKTFPPARNNHEAKTIAWPGRIPAVTDPKMIVAWNSLMISGLARAATAFNQPEYLQMAIAAANFILQNQWVEGRFQRLNYDGQAAVLAQSEDYALFIKALLDLHQSSLGLGDQFTHTAVAPLAPQNWGELELKSPRIGGFRGLIENGCYWLEQAVRVQAEFDEYLWSLELGGYYNTAADASRDLLVRERSYIDNATPAANGVAIANLVRLALLSENLDYLDRAEQGLQAFASIMEKSPQACPSLFVALDWYRTQTLVRTTSDRLQQIAVKYLPTAVYRVESDLPADAVGLVCQGLSCREPARSLDQLWEQLHQSQLRTAS